MDQIITDICNAGDKDSIREVLERYSRMNGFYGFAYTILSRQPTSVKILSFVLNYSPEWMERYNINQYYLHDHVLLLAGVSKEPFVWSEVISSLKLSHKSSLVMREAENYNIKNGLSIPANPLKGIYFHYLCNHVPNMLVRKKMMLISHLATEQMERILNISFLKKLTSRECECLIWTAAGKTSEEIGVILGIAARTVNKYVNNAMKKLNACNKTQAVCKALMQQEFSFSTIPM